MGVDRPPRTRPPGLFGEQAYPPVEPMQSTAELQPGRLSGTAEAVSGRTAAHCQEGKGEDVSSEANGPEGGSQDS